MLIVVEGLAMCFILLLVCVIGMADGAVGSVYFYEPEVQAKVVELGLTTREEIRKRYMIAGAALFIPILFFVPAIVWYINAAREFVDIFLQMTAILMIVGLFDRIFIDWYWVGKTKAWIIPGTESLRPYIPMKTLLKKWIGTLIGYPLLAAVTAAILSLL